MSRTAETYIDKPRKFVHDLFGVTGGIALFAAAIFLLAGHIGGAFVWGLPGFALTHIASKIKYTWVKRIEVGAFELV